MIGNAYQRYVIKIVFIYFRFSSINKTKGLKLSFERKQKLRQDIKKTRELSRTLINERNSENEARKERRRENIKRRAENQKKSEIVQVVIYISLIFHFLSKINLSKSLYVLFAILKQPTLKFSD